MRGHFINDKHARRKNVERLVQPGVVAGRKGGHSVRTWPSSSLQGRAGWRYHLEEFITRRKCEATKLPL